MAKLVFGVLAAVGGHFAYTKLTQFEEDVFVEFKEVRDNYTMKLLLGNRYVVKTDDKTFNPRRVFWNYPPVLEAEGLYKNFVPGERYHIKGYGINYPRFHLYPNITNVAWNTESKMYRVRIPGKSHMDVVDDGNVIEMSQEEYDRRKNLEE
jgi:hypothetical protein